MKRINIKIQSLERLLNFKFKKILFIAFISVFIGLSPLYAQRVPININLIIDGSSSLSGVKNEVTAWVSDRLDQILTDGDTITVWNAGQAARVVYTGKINNAADRGSVKKSVSDIAPAGNNTDFTGALREAASRRDGAFSYTLLISASPQTLSNMLSGPQASLLRYSRVEEFSSWRAIVVGQNIDSRVRSAAAAFMNN